MVTLEWLLVGTMMLTLHFVKFFRLWAKGVGGCQLLWPFSSRVLLSGLFVCHLKFAAMNPEDAKSFLVDVFPCLGKEATRISNQAKIVFKKVFVVDF